MLFIPPHLAQRVVEYSQITQLQDEFGHQRLREKRSTAGQIDVDAWAPPIEQDFTQWLRENINRLPVAREQVDEILSRRARP